MHRIISDISEFIFVEDSPQRADVIIAVGGSMPQIAESAASLYHDGFAPYIVAGGGYSVKIGFFKGPSDKNDIYNKHYRTECDFYTDVLLNNGVPESAILHENRSGHTRENAEFAKRVIEEHGLSVKVMIVVCKRFHARRCQIFFQSAFPDAVVLIVPTDVGQSQLSLTRDNWYTTKYGIGRVLGELKRCGTQITVDDISLFMK